ncbi:Holliday junction resolvase [Cupriavidus taiwanensis]|uniref:RusA family crossover junction endodeoxyribonuclease n=1 Tax=Cupriavidus taiwanensis TaxID=164546 RepID=UPI000E19AA53|nr:RusA family crossover junction endodeoxyribonuclease [Cupriavidus taiwanensis]SOZ99475.1 Holliday junction resolvase [Cupriavidus taiwanensis]
MRVTLTIPGVPVPKGRPRFRNRRTKSGAEFVQAYSPEKTRSYDAVVRTLAEQAMAGRPPLTGALQVNFVAFLPVPRSWPQKRSRSALEGRVLPTYRPDLDNMIKNVLDGSNGILFADDSLITDMVVSKRYSDRPRAVLEVIELDPESEVQS